MEILHSSGMEIAIWWLCHSAYTLWKNLQSISNLFVQFECEGRRL